MPWIRQPRSKLRSKDFIRQMEKPGRLWTRRSSFFVNSFFAFGCQERISTCFYVNCPGLNPPGFFNLIMKLWRKLLFRESLVLFTKMLHGIILATRKSKLWSAGHFRVSANWLIPIRLTLPSWPLKIPLPEVSFRIIRSFAIITCGLSVKFISIFKWTWWCFRVPSLKTSKPFIRIPLPFANVPNTLRSTFPKRRSGRTRTPPHQENCW